MSLDHEFDSEEQEKQVIQRETLRRLVRSILRHRWLFFWGSLLICAGAGATLTEPWLFGYSIDEAIVPKNWQRLRDLTLIFLAVECVRVGTLIGQGYLFELLGQRVMHELRLELFSHLQRLPVATFDKNPVGRLVTRVTNDVSALAEMFSAGFITIVLNFLIVVGTLAWLLTLDLRLGLIAASVFPVLIGASIYFSAKLRVAYRSARSKLSSLNAFLAENILGMRIVNLFNRQRLHLERFMRINEWYAKAQIDSVRIYAYFQPLITWCAGISVALLIGFGGMRAVDGQIKVGVLVAFFSYAMAMFQPVREIADKWNIFLSGMASAERIFSILDWKPELEVAESEVAVEPIPGLRGHIRFENVWFAYQGEHWILRDFSLDIPAGSRIGVVGHTGAGKTTLISLLMRFYEPQRGRILLDGKDLREYDKRRLRASIGIVQQDVFLFSGSIRENIHLWREPSEGSAEAVEKVLAPMGLGRWVSESTGEIQLQERGNNLSMGERQVMAFARALAARPSIWILDEATANIDSESERKLELALDSASRSRTSILIAHRLATVRSADLILVLHKGAILESGDHASLIAHDGLYARLYRYQTAVVGAAVEGVSTGGSGGA